MSHAISRSPDIFPPFGTVLAGATSPECIGMSTYEETTVPTDGGSIVRERHEQSESERRLDVRVPSRIPMVGRLTELRTLHEAFSEVSEGGSSVVGVRGELGIGKTRLVREFAGDLQKQRVRCQFTRCTETLREPLAPIARLLHRSVSDEAIPPATRKRCEAVIGDLLEQPEDPGARRTQLFLDLTDLLIAIGAGRPLVVVVDDVQWADELTHQFVEFFANEVLDDPTNARCLLLLTERTGGEQVMTVESCCARIASWIHLGPMDRSAFRLLLQAVGVERPSPRLAADLWHQAGGNTLHLIESIRRLADLRAFVERDQVVEIDDQAVPSDLPTLPAMLRQGLDAIPEATRSVLQGAAILGHEVPLSRLGQLLNYAVGTLRDILRPAISQGIVDVNDDELSFNHPLFRQVLEQETDRRQRAEFHAGAVATILGDHVSGADALVAAPHIMEAGSTLELPDERRQVILQLAAERAFALAAWEDAHRIYNALLADETLDPERQGWLHYQAGRSAELSFAWPLAEQHYQRAAELAEVDDDPQLGAWAAISHLHARTVAGRHPTHGDKLDTSSIERFLARLGSDDTAAEVVVRTQLSQSLASMGELDRAQLFAAEAVELAAANDDEQLLVRALMTAGLAALFKLEVTDALEYYERGTIIAERIGDDLRHGHGLTRLALLRLMTGELDLARQVADQARSPNQRNRQWGDLALLAGVHAQICLLRGDFVGVESWGREGEYNIELADYPFAPGVLYPILAVTRALQGESGAAMEAIDAWSAKSGRPHRSTRAQIARWADPEVAPSPRPWSGPVTMPNLSLFLSSAELVVEPADANLFLELLAEIPDAEVTYAPGSVVSVERARAKLLETLDRSTEAIAAAQRAVATSTEASANLDTALSLSTLGRCRALDPRHALNELTSAWRIAVDLDVRPVADAIESTAKRIDPSFALRSGDTRESDLVVLFVDMVGSTAISVTSDRLYVELVDQEFAIVRSRVAEFGGTEFGTSGDAVLSWFSSVDQATRCAFGIHADVALAVAGSPAPHSLAVKIGIASGRLLERDGYLYGRVVNLAARLSDQASAGRTVLTADLEPELPEGADIESLGPVELKGFDAALPLIAAAPGTPSISSLRRL